MAKHAVSLLLRVFVLLVSLIATHIAANNRDTVAKTSGNDLTTDIDDNRVATQGYSDIVTRETIIENIVTTSSLKDDDFITTGSDDGLTTVSDNGMTTRSNNDRTTVSEDGMTTGSNDDMTTGSDDGMATGSDDGLTTVSDDGVTTVSVDGITTGSEDGMPTGSENGMTTGSENVMQTGSDDGLTTGSDDGTTIVSDDMKVTAPCIVDHTLPTTTNRVNEEMASEFKHIPFLVSTMDIYGVPTLLTPGKQSIEITCSAVIDGINIIEVNSISLYRTRSDSFTMMTEIVSVVKMSNTSTIRWSDETLQAREGVTVKADLSSNRCFLDFVIDFHDSRCEDAEEYRCMMSALSSTGPLTAISHSRRTHLYPAMAPSYTDDIQVINSEHIKSKPQHEYPIGSEVTFTCRGSVGSDRLRHKWHVAFVDDPCNTATVHIYPQSVNASIQRAGCDNIGSSTAFLTIPDLTQPIVVWCWVSNAEEVAEDCHQLTDNNLMKSVTILPVRAKTKTEPCDEPALRPDINMTPERTAYRRGESLNLTCNYTGMQDQAWFFRRLPSETWTHLLYNVNENQQRNSFTLVIPKLALIHKGWYACTPEDCSLLTSDSNENHTVFVDVVHDHCRRDGILLPGDSCVAIIPASSCAENNGTIASIHSDEKAKIIYGFAFHELLIETDVIIGLSLTANTVTWKNLIWKDGSPVTFMERLSSSVCFICLEQYPADLAMTYDKVLGYREWVVALDHTYVACEWQEERQTTGLRMPPGTHSYTGSKDMFQCNSGEYISTVYKCDGTADCSDVSDEQNCRKGCEGETFQCDYGDCIPVSKSCDFIKDCADGSDELVCNYPPCNDGYWQCANKECIPVYDVCDGDVECIDGSDEADVLCTDSNVLPSDYTFRCFEPNRILPLARKCDGIVDCSDKLESDETSCSSLIPYYSCMSWVDRNTNVIPSEVAVDYGMPQYGKSQVQCFIADKMVHTTWKFSPDQDIAIPYRAVSVVSKALWFETKWTSWQFQPINYESPFQQKVMLETSSSCVQYIRPCGYFIYIPGVVIEWQNGNGDIYTMAIDDYEGCFGVCTAVECSVLFTYDELQNSQYFDGNEAFGWIPVTNKLQLPITSVRSSFVTIIGVSRLICSEDLHNNDTEPVAKYLKCKNELHYDPALRCLMNFDLTGEPIACRDLTHLENCETFTCPEYYVKCPESFCLHMRYICDGIGHCPNREDELDCKTTNCTNHYRCRGGQPCVPFTYLCDGVRQCPMGDDELHCDVTCPKGCSCSTLAFVCISEKDDIHLSNITSTARSISMKANLKDLTNHFPLSFPLLTNIILQSCSLQILRFQGQSIFKNMTALRHLDISSNNIQNLPEDIFRDITDLRTLIISNNPLALISDRVFSGLRALKTLQISHSNIRDLHIESNVFAELSSLEYLDLSANKISRLSNNIFSKLITLQTLILRDNPLVSIDVQAFSRLYSLSSLQLSNINSERILSGVFSGLQSLTTLNLSSSGIRNLGQRSFQDLANLEKLDIQNNQFEVQEFMFDGLDNLQYLYADTYKMCCIKPKSVLDENCFAPADLISSCSNLIGSDFLRVCLWVIALLALLGNIFVIIYRLLIDKGNLKKSQSIFVINLSVSDLIMGIYMILIASVDTYYSGRYVVHDSNWRQGTLCVTAGCLSVISSEMSTFAILMITIDRFMVIVFPLSLRRITWKIAVLLCLMFWIMSVVLAIVPEILFPGYFKGEFYSRSGVCLALPLTGGNVPGQEYSVAIFIGLNGVLFLFILIAQICIHRKCKGTRSISTTRNRKQEIALAKSLCFVVGTDFLCWFPVGVVGMWSQLGGSVSADVYAWVMVFVLPVNSAINPFLYTYFYIKRNQDIVVTINNRKHVPGAANRKRLMQGGGLNTSDILKELYFCKLFNLEKGSVCLTQYAEERKISPTQAYQIAKGTMKALSFLHCRHTIHGNVSDKNVFVNNYDEAVKRARLVLEKSRVDGDHDSHTDIMQYGQLIKMLLSMLDRY